MGERKLAAVFLVTRDVDGLVPFYRDVVGLRVSRYEPGHSAWLDAGPVDLVIHRPQPDPAGPGDFLPEAEVALWLGPSEGVAAAAKHLAEAGVAVLAPERAANYAYFRDPEGRLLGLHERA